MSEWRRGVFFLVQIPIGVVVGGGPLATRVLESRWFQKFQAWAEREAA